MDSVIRVLLADGRPPVLHALRRLLARDPAIEVLDHQAQCASAALRLALDLRPDLLVLDYYMPGRPAAEVVRQVAARSPATRILVYTGYPDAACLREMRRLGVAGYLLKTEPPETVLLAIGLVARGGTWFPKDVVFNAPDGVPCPALTERERDVLRFLVEGLTDREIAARAGVSARAVRHALRRVHDKLGANGRVQAVAWALRLGLVE